MFGPGHLENALKLQSKILQRLQLGEEAAMVDAGWLAASTLCIASFSTPSPSLPHLSVKPFSSPISINTTICNHNPCPSIASSFRFNAKHEDRSIIEISKAFALRKCKISDKNLNDLPGKSSHAFGFPLSRSTRVRVIREEASALCGGTLAFLQPGCLASSVLFDAGGGNFGSSGGGEGWGGDGGGGSHSLSTTVHASSAEADDNDNDRTTEVDDEILLEVKGMSCGGCALAVKKVLESQPEVISATVDLARETASVHVKSMLGAAREWEMVKIELGHSLASSLTSSGFKSSVKVDSATMI